MSANLYDIYHCCVYSKNLLLMERGTVRNTKSPADGKRNCPKHESHSKNKFEKLVHLVGFIVRFFFYISLYYVMATQTVAMILSNNLL